MSSFFDPAIPRKSGHVDRALDSSAAGIPIPSVVEISESGTCNRSCKFCPRSNPDFPDVKEFIPPALLDKLTRQLAEIGFKGIFLFSGFVEPLLDKAIFDHVATVRRNLPEAKPEMVTNGDVLTEDRLKRLFDAGLSTILISVYDSAEDAERFEAMCRGVGLSDDQFVIRHRYLPPTSDFGITLSNRAGLMQDAEYAIDDTSEPLAHPCHYPLYTFFMDYLGDALLCPHDWGKKLIIGNMHEQNFQDIWTGPKANMARRRLLSSDRGFPPCNVCDVKGTLMGQKHAEAWAAYYGLSDKE